MGIRFACHACQKPLNIKNELAGKRGVCPQCKSRFRIPLQDAAHSIPIEQPALENGSKSEDDDFELGNQQDDADTTDIPAPAVATASRNLRPGMPSLLDDPVATWYVRPPSGGQYGPATGDMLRGWIDEARVTPTSLVWRDGWPQWRSAGEALVEFGVQSSAPTTKYASPSSTKDSVVTPTLSGDATIGTRKRRITQKRFIFIGTLAAISMTLIGLLIYLVGR